MRKYIYQTCMKGLCGVKLVVTGALRGSADADDGVKWVGCLRNNDDRTVTGHVWTPPSKAAVAASFRGDRGSTPACAATVPFWFSPDGDPIARDAVARSASVYDPEAWDERALVDDALLGGAPEGSAYVVYERCGEWYASAPTPLRRGGSCRELLRLLAELDAPHLEQPDCVDDDQCLERARVAFYRAPTSAPNPPDEEGAPDGYGPDVTDVVRALAGPDAECWSGGCGAEAWPRAKDVLDFYSSFRGAGPRHAHSELSRPGADARVECEFADGSVRVLR